ncbi:hypothetical protein PHAMO_400063 [Magnetospirillum molischianum DSM 120]|uniref:Uncharacterized protein n=1 Tax=Magnetospirillum molischianum DSM 120 TaxID=1150626 RepID=H8FWE4_MAGML|nr:hypothetical protein PHAMO_400063 [Magnetospirillum molischianum DSM 120]
MDGESANAREPLPLYCRVPPADWIGPERPNFYPDERSKLTALAALHPNLRVITVDRPGPHRFDEDPTCLFQRYGLAARAAENIGWLLGPLEQARTANAEVAATVAAKGESLPSIPLLQAVEARFFDRRSNPFRGGRPKNPRNEPAGAEPLRPSSQLRQWPLQSNSVIGNAGFNRSTGAFDWMKSIR